MCVVVAFMVRVEHRGVTSFISKLGLLPRFYDQILHFFRSDAYETEEVYQAWIGIAQEHTPFEEEGEYVILVADPIKVAKEGKRMPAVHVYHQESENAAKREYAEGHQFGMVSAIVNCGTESRSLPLVSGLQVSKTKTGKDSLIEQMVKQGASTLPSLNKPGLLTLDAYHCAGSARVLRRGSPFIWENPESPLPVQRPNLETCLPTAWQGPYDSVRFSGN